MMAKPPQDWQNPRAAGPAELPASMVNAVRLMYASAGIAVVFGVIAALTMHASRQVVHVGNPGSGVYRAGYVVGGAIFGLIVGGLWLWMAWANKRGRAWARILSTVFFGLLTFYAVGVLLTLPAAAKIVIIVEWAAGLAATVFLWQRQSSQYYTTVGQPTGSVPVPWGQQYGQQPYAQQLYNPSPYGQPPVYGQPPQHPSPGHGQPPPYGQPPVQSGGQPPDRHPGQHLDQPGPPSPS
jgi:hypothetical protein